MNALISFIKTKDERSKNPAGLYALKQHKKKKINMKERDIEMK